MKAKKRIVSWILSIVMILSLMPMNIFAVGGYPSVTLEAKGDKSTYLAGERIEVEVYYNAVDAVDINAFDIAFTYDENFIEPITDQTEYLYDYFVKPSPSAMTSWSTVTGTTVPGYVSVSNVGTASLKVEANSKTLLGTLNFAVISDGNTGVSTIGMETNLPVDELNMQTMFVATSIVTEDGVENKIIPNVDFTSTASINIVKEGLTLSENSVLVDGNTTNSPKTVTITAYDSQGLDITDTTSFEVTSDVGDLDGSNFGLNLSENIISITLSAVAGNYKVKGGGYEATLTVTRNESIVSGVHLSAGQAELTIPAIGENAVTSSAFIVEVTDQYSSPMTGQTVNWTIADATGDPVEGVTISNGVVTVTNDATSDIRDTADLTITASAENVSNTATITVKRADSVATSMAFYKAINAGTAELVDTLNDTITIPPMGQTIVTYTAKVLDQYGSEIGSATVDNGEITVTVNDVEETKTVTATYTGLTNAELTVDIISIDFTVLEGAIVVNPNATYGDTWAEIVTINEALITAQVGSTIIAGGEYRLEQTGTPDAGNTVVFNILFNGGGYTDVLVHSGTANIARKEITEAIVPNLPAMTYTGAGLEPTVTVTGLTLDTDYTVDYENNIDIDITAQSIPQVTITGIGNYHGTVYKTFTINKATITSLATTAPNNQGMIANADMNQTAERVKEYAIAESTSTYEPLDEVTVNFGDGLTDTLFISWADATETFDPKGGTYTYVGTLVATDNFTNADDFTLTATTTVTPVEANLGMLYQQTTYTMAQIDSATELTQLYVPTEISANYNTNLVADATYNITGWDKTIDDLKAIDASIENQIVTLTPTFNAPVWATIMNTPTYIFTITNKFPVNVNFTTAIDDVTYGTALATPVAEQTAIDNGTDATATFTYLYEGVNGTTYNSETPPTDAGQYQVTATLVSDTHSGSATDNFTIAQKALADDMLAITGTYTYTGQAITPTYTVTDGTPSIISPVDYSVVEENNINAGEATLVITATPNGNYSGSVQETFTIGKKESQPIEGIDKDYLYSKANLNNIVDIVGLPEDRGITTFTSVENDVNSIIENLANTSTGITFDTAIGNENDTATIAVTATMQNYQDATIYVNVKLVDKISQEITGVSVSNKEYDGQVIVTTGTPTAPSYTGTYEYVWNTADTNAPKDAGTYTLTVKIPDSDETYMGSQVIENIEISTKALTVKPTNIIITNGTDLPTEFALEYVGIIANDEIIPVGTPIFEIQDGEGNQVTTSEESGDYFIVWTNKNDVTIEDSNYTITKEDGTFTINTPSSPRPPADPAPEDSSSSGSSDSSDSTGDGTSSAETTVSSTTSNGVSKAEITESTLEDMVNEVTANDNDATPEVVISVNTSSTSNGLELTVPTESLQELAKNDDALLTVTSDIGSVTFDSEAIDAISENGEEIVISVKEADKDSLNDRQLAKVKDNPVFDLTVMVGNSYVTDFNGGMATVTLPYELDEKENPNKIKIYYIDGDGNLEKMIANYDVKTKTISFTTTHFSTYMIAYEGFDDVSLVDWFYDSVEYATEEGLFNGVSEDEFAPNDEMTRAMVWTVLARMDGIDTTGGEFWYSKGLEWAISNEISDGTNPNGDITREQLVTMLYRYAGSNGDMAVTTQTMLGQFTDESEISEYAVQAMEWAVKEGIITGTSDTTIAPRDKATRAQVATMFMRYTTTD